MLVMTRMTCRCWLDDSSYHVIVFWGIMKVQPDHFSDVCSCCFCIERRRRGCHRHIVRVEYELLFCIEGWLYLRVCQGLAWKLQCWSICFLTWRGRRISLIFSEPVTVKYCKIKLSLDNSCLGGKILHDNFFLYRLNLCTIFYWLVPVRRSNLVECFWTSGRLLNHLTWHDVGTTRVQPRVVKIPSCDLTSP